MPVVPIVATTAHASSSVEELGTHPELVVDRAPSGARARGAARPCRPTSARAPSTTRTRRSGCSARARSPARRTCSSTPCPRCGPRSPSREADAAGASQSSVTSSSSCSAGDVRQRIPTWLRPAIRSSASTPGSEPGRREVGEEARALPVREPGHEHAVEVARAPPRTAPAPPAARREARRGSRRARPARAPGGRATRSRYDATQSTASAPSSLNELTSASFSISRQERVFRICSFVSHARRACATPSSA